MEKSRYFEELVVGEEFRSPSRTIAEYDLYVFAGLTGDLTPPTAGDAPATPPKADEPAATPPATNP